MRKSDDVFVPSQVLDDIYDTIEDYVAVAANEDIYYRDIITRIVNLLDDHINVRQFVWGTCANDSKTGGILFISWIERGQLRCEHYKYTNEFRGEY